VGHRFETGHNTDFNNTSIVDRATGYTDNVINEAIQIRLHTNNFNRVPGFTLSQSWHPPTNMIKKYTDASIQRQAKAKQAPESAHQPPLASVQLEHEPQQVHRWDAPETVLS
jgi:hypothetical protein